MFRPLAVSNDALVPAVGKEYPMREMRPGLFFHIRRAAALPRFATAARLAPPVQQSLLIIGVSPYTVHRENKVLS
jgi:hypothetical protein